MKNNNKAIALAALVLSGVLALAGCGASNASSGSADAKTSSSSSKSASSSDDSASSSNSAGF